MSGDNEASTLANKSVLKALAVLTALGDYPDGASATDLAEATGTSRPTVFRMLLSLETAGYVERTGSTYRLGWELVRLSRLPHLDRGLSAKLQPILNKYAQQVNEPVNFALRGSRGSFDIVAEGISNRFLTTEEQFLGSQFPPHASSTGKLMLSELPDAKVLKLLPARLEKFTEQTITSRKRLLEELTLVRSQGYATLDNELEIGLFSLSVPVRRASGLLIGVMAVYGPSERLKLHGVPNLVKLLQEAGAEVLESIDGN
ncbi:IclR family transcriptional regulator [Glutamicibacter ectropisis]|uniref:Glycerol operon regulatory protein n=1 Tax=Glutamicibacter ectropisis TaxID=3046593 RepID=A0AAU6WE24_9MICC